MARIARGTCQGDGARWLLGVGEDDVLENAGGVLYALGAGAQHLTRLDALEVGAARSARDLRKAADELAGDLIGGRLAGTLDALSPLKVLSRGYAIATDDTGHVIKEASELQPGQAVGVRLGSGSVTAQVLSVNP